MSEGFAACLDGDLRRYRALTRGVPVGSPLSIADRLRILSPRLMPNILIRAAFTLDRSGFGPIARLVSLIAFLLFGLEFAIRCPIGPGLFLPHTQGTVLGAASVGRNATIYQGVTLGAKSFPLDGEGHPIKGIARHPIVEDDVVIYAGATILGRITVGKGSVIGGNVWLTRSVPPYSQVTQAQTREGGCDEAFSSGSGI